jgi:putative ABC transport system permease protein
MTPPRLPHRILSWWLPADDRDEIIGDLNEQFSARAAAGGRGGASRWYWRQTAHLVGRWRPRVGAVLTQDVRYALRQLRRSPGYALTAIVTLALGIGANTAIFSIVDAAVLRPLPYPHAERLVRFALSNGTRRITGMRPVDFLDWRDQQQVFDQIAVTGGNSATMLGGGEPEDIDISRVTAGFFQTYGVAPAFGRDFDRDDERVGEDHKLIISDEFWRDRLGRDPRALGRTLHLDGVPYEVVGILPPGFRYPANSRTDLFMPMTFTPADRQHGVIQSSYLGCVARLKPGVTIEEAAAQMSLLQTRLDPQHVAYDKGYTRVELTPLLDFYVGDARAWMLLLLGAVTLVLLIACANVANLVIAHSSTRVRELTLRAALGASRARIVRQLLTESLVLAAGGGLAGVMVAYGALPVLMSALPSSIPRAWAIGIDLRVLVFTAVVALATGLLCGLLPALRGGRVELVAGLKEGTGGTTHPRRQRARQVLACVEMTLAVMLLIGAGLFISSFARLASLDRGFDGAHITTASVALPRLSDPSGAGRVYLMDLKTAIARIPGVAQVAIVDGPPLASGWAAFPLTVVGRPAPPKEGAEMIRHRAFSADVFDVLRIPLRRGRAWTAHDSPSTPLVTVINEAAASRFWPGEDPIGQRIVIRTSTYEIIGVAADVRYSSLVQAPAPEAYLAFEQSAATYGTFLARSVPGAPDPGAAIQAAVWRINPSQPVHLGTIDKNYLQITASRRFNMLIMSVFGLLALGVAATGIYGVMSFLVETRKREMAVRLALGAQARQVAGLIVGQSAVVIVAGISFGLVGAWWLAHLVQTFLFEVQPRDPAVFAASAVLLGLVAALATWVPARRAGRVDPIGALKGE